VTGEDWGSNRALLLAVDADFGQLGRIEAELSRAFGADYRVRGELTPEDALRTLHDAARRNERVAVVLVDETFADDARSEIFATTRTLHPNARRALLVAWGAWAHPGSAERILRSMAIGDISYYVLKPWTRGDEFFHRTIAEFVLEWSRGSDELARGRGGRRTAFRSCVRGERPVESQRDTAHLLGDGGPGANAEAPTP
jgi:thioredoxin reductase (NADPH)